MSFVTTISNIDYASHSTISNNCCALVMGLVQEATEDTTQKLQRSKDVIEYLSKEGFIPNSVDQEAKKWLAEDVKCNQCSHKPRGMGMSFKKHLEDHYNC